MAHEQTRRSVTEKEEILAQLFLNENLNRIATHLIRWRTNNGHNRTLVNKFETERRRGDVKIVYDSSEDLTDEPVPTVRVSILIKYIDSDLGYLALSIVGGRVTNMEHSNVSSAFHVAA